MGIQGAYAVSAGVWAICATLPFFFAFWGTYERHQESEQEEIPFFDGLKITFRNRAFRYVTGIYLLSWLVVQTVSTIVIYYMTYWLRQPGLVPVSYTHLRAHETVLDLVCRLLLEKKKQ